MELQAVHVTWDYRVAIDLFLGGVGVGVFLLAAYLYYVSKDRFWRVIKLGFTIAPFLVGLGVFALMTELGKPFRMFSTYINFNPTSITSWGGYIQTIFILLGFVIVYFIYKKDQRVVNTSQFKIVLATCSIFAIGVGVYHGLLLASLGRPLWMNGLIPIMFLVSSLLAGGSLVLGLTAITTKLSLKSKIASQTFVEMSSSTEETSDVNFSLIITSMILLEIALLIVWRVTLDSTGLDVKEAYTNMVKEYGSYWWSLAIGIGLIFPLLISFYYTIKKRVITTLPAVLITISLLVGSYTFKHIILYAGQMNIPIL